MAPRWRPRYPFPQKRLCSCPRGAFAPATVTAVMLTTRRTVADGVRMCTGRAAPSRIGPMVTPPPPAVLSRLNEMFAASRFGMMRRFASPRSFELGRALGDELERAAHLGGGRRAQRAEVRSREQRHLGHDAEAPHRLGGEQ